MILRNTHFEIDIDPHLLSFAYSTCAAILKLILEDDVCNVQNVDVTKRIYVL